MKPEYTIKLSAQMLEQLGIILLEHPYKIVAPIINTMNQQIQDQNTEKDGE